ncbi:MAG TPA: heme-binding domain-containing protein [Chitinophagaceae bacterium]|nr:heme-binding domain-containing protein [Chitinophagaceae bacterium]
MLKKILLVLLLGLIVIQFIHPKRNISSGPQPNYIGNTFAVPAPVKVILQKACFDCHSNNTRYLWYFRLQPLDWWLTNHINHGKEHLNFDEFTNRAARYQYHKMEEVIQEVKEDHMPLKSYKWTHKDARLTDPEKHALTDWAQSVMRDLEAKYPPDSLRRSNGR